MTGCYTSSTSVATSLAWCCSCPKFCTYFCAEWYTCTVWMWIRM